MSNETPRPPAPPKISARTWMIASVIGAGAFIALLDGTVANVALESIRDDYGAKLTVVQWVVTGYLIALAVSLPAAGWLGQRYGYGRVWAASLATFTLGSTLCALAPNVGTLIAARVLQGLAAGLMIPSGQAVIGSVVGPAQLGRVMGALGVVVSLGPAVGPAVAGAILEVATWHWLFWINVPLGLAALGFAWRLVPGGTRNKCRPLDLGGLLLLGIGLPLLLYGATEIAAQEELALASSWISLTALAVGGLMTAAFVIYALRREHALIDLRLLGCRTFATATGTTCFTGANIFGGLLLLPLYLLLIEGHSDFAAGLILLAMGLGSATALYVGGSLTDRFGPGPIMLVGGTLMVLSLIPFLFATPLPTWLLLAFLIPRGVGIALAQMPAMTAAYGAVRTEEIGDAATLVNITQRVGGALGAVAVVVALIQTGGSQSPGAYAIAFGLLAAFSGVIPFTGLILWRHQNELHRAESQAQMKAEPQTAKQMMLE